MTPTLIFSRHHLDAMATIAGLIVPLLVLLGVLVEEFVRALLVLLNRKASLRVMVGFGIAVGLLERAADFNRVPLDELKLWAAWSLSAAGSTALHLFATMVMAASLRRGARWFPAGVGAAIGMHLVLNLLAMNSRALGVPITVAARIAVLALCVGGVVWILRRSAADQRGARALRAAAVEDADPNGPR